MSNENTQMPADDTAAGPPRTVSIPFGMRLFNSFLRLLPMAAKFLLTIYMGRYYSLDDMGIYGLAFGTVIIMTTVLGQRLDFIITRDIVGSPLDVTAQKIRDGVIFYGLNYLLLAFSVGLMIAFHMTQLPSEVLIYILLLSIFESMGSLFNSLMNSLNMQVKANVVFLIRGGLWVLPVIILGVVDAKFRNYNTVLSLWAAGGGLSLFMTAWYWRKLPWHEVISRPVDWHWIITGVKKSFFFWLGMIGLIGGSFCDRFIIVHFLRLDYVGILTFYSSFTNAMLTLMQSGVIVFAYPRLILLHREADKAGFHHELWRTVRQMALGATIVCIFLGAGVPVVARMLGKTAFVTESWTFVLLLIGMWIRVNAETFFYVLFARHQDRPLWLGNLLFLLPTLGGSFILVPLLGFSGIGYSCIISGLFLLLWRLWYIRDLIFHWRDGKVG